MTAQLNEPQVRATDSATVAVVFVVVVAPVVAVAVALFYSRSLVRGLGLPIIAVVVRRLLLLISGRGTPSFTQLINWRGFPCAIYVAHLLFPLPLPLPQPLSSRVESGPKCLLRGAFQLDWLPGPLGAIYVANRGSIYRFYSCTSDRSTNFWPLASHTTLLLSICCCFLYFKIAFISLEWLKKFYWLLVCCQNWCLLAAVAAVGAPCATWRNQSI